MNGSAARRLLVFLFATLAQAFCHPQVSSSADRIRVGLSSFTPINAALWIAEDKGLFKKNGIEAEVVVMAGAAAGGISSLIAGDVQFLGGGGGAVINAGLSGADVVMIGSIVNKGVQRVMARSEIRRPEDLRNKKVGVTRFGAASHLVLLMMLRGLLHPGSDGFNMVRNIVIGSIPVVIAGYILHKTQPSFVCLVEIMAWMSIIFGLVLWAADKFSPATKTAEQIGWKDALLVGLAQCVALIPGVSRSGITMTAGRFLGYSRVEAARYSLLLSIVAIAGAGLLGALDIIESGDTALNRDAVIAGVIAFAAGYITIALMVRWLKNFSFTPFAIYRIALGVILLGLIYTGML